MCPIYAELGIEPRTLYMLVPELSQLSNSPSPRIFLPLKSMFASQIPLSTLVAPLGRNGWLLGED